MRADKKALNADQTTRSSSKRIPRPRHVNTRACELGKSSHHQILTFSFRVDKLWSSRFLLCGSVQCAARTLRAGERTHMRRVCVQNFAPANQPTLCHLVGRVGGCWRVPSLMLLFVCVSRAGDNDDVTKRGNAVVRSLTCLPACLPALSSPRKMTPVLSTHAPAPAAPAPAPQLSLAEKLSSLPDWFITGHVRLLSLYIAPIDKFLRLVCLCNIVHIYTLAAHSPLRHTRQVHVF